MAAKSRLAPRNRTEDPFRDLQKKADPRQKGQERSCCFARMAFPAQIQRLPNLGRNASRGKRNAAHEEASELLVHQRKKEDPARDHSTGGEGPTEVHQDQSLFQFIQFNIRLRPYFFDFLFLQSVFFGFRIFCPDV